MTCPACQAENDSAASACIACGEALGASSASLGAGTVFAGRYEILGTVGRGGMGMVYRARDRDLRENVALKVIRPDLARQQHMAHRFRSEIKLARRVRHRNVCSIYGDGEDRGLLYICMELVDGTDLREVVRARGGLPPAEAFDLIVQIAEGLKAIHEVGIIHRDLKTANIMRDARGLVRLMDFGIAKQWQAQGTTGATATGQVLGTPEYMSPEQIRGLKVDFRTDVYAFGIVSYEIFTGTVPFRGETAVATIFKQLQDAPPLRTRGARALPRTLVPVLRRALAKEPSGRFPSAADMLAELRRAREEYRAAPDRMEAGDAEELLAESPTDGDGTMALASAPTIGWPGSPSSPPAGTRGDTSGPGDPPSLPRRSVAIGALAVMMAGGIWGWSRSGVGVPSPSPSVPGVTQGPATPQAPSPHPVVTLAVSPNVSGESRSPAPPLMHWLVVAENEADIKPVTLSFKHADYPRDTAPIRPGQRASVTVEFTVTEDGDVADIVVLESAGGAIDRAVVEAYAKARFKPGLKDGIPVKVRLSRRQTFLGR